MSSHKGGGWGTYRTLETSHRDGTRDSPTGGRPLRKRSAHSSRRVTSHQGGWKSHPQGKGAQVVRGQQPCGTRNAESHSGAELSLVALRRQDWPLESEVIRKRSRFVRRGATGKGPSQDGTSPVALYVKLSLGPFVGGLSRWRTCSGVRLRGKDYSRLTARPFRVERASQAAFLGLYRR